MSKSKPQEPFSEGIRLLARRAYSVAELRRALARKFPSSSSISEAIARLRQLGYLDDRKFAEQVAGSLARHRAFGRYRIRRELKARLVDYRVIDPAVEQAFEETNERDLLERALEKKLRTLRPPFTASRLASLCRSLLRRGFSAGDIMKAVRARRELDPVADDVDLSELEGSGDKF